jgi:hypothetical protein
MRLRTGSHVFSALVGADVEAVTVVPEGENVV